MARRLTEPNRYGGTTDHLMEIAVLRQMGEDEPTRQLKLCYWLAADLLEAHDQTGISLDDWPSARQFVEMLIKKPIIPNLV